MSIKHSTNPPIPPISPLTERRQCDVERATSHLISSVQNTCDPANQQSPRDRAARHSALGQAVVMALSTTLSCNPNREARILLNDEGPPLPPGNIDSTPLQQDHLLKGVQK